MPRLQYAAVQTALDESDLAALAPHMLALMLRNVATDGYAFLDPYVHGVLSRPGCVIASPSYHEALTEVDQDYVFNWTRDAALTALELAAQGDPSSSFPDDYVRFAATCREAAVDAGDYARACFRIDGAARAWSAQTDGPALQTLAILALWDALSPGARDQARDVVAANLAFLLGAYTGDTITLWEESARRGRSFFARSVQLRCFREVAGNAHDIPVPDGVGDAIDGLAAALDEHWDGERYLSLLPRSEGFDPNIDIVLASVCGAVACTDPRLLATAAELRAQWADPASDRFYAINGDDAARGLGPLLGRYRDDRYDGDVLGDPDEIGHPWALSTCAFAELYYRVAAEVARDAAARGDALAAPFFAQAGVAADTPGDAAVAALRDAGDRMLRAVVFHSDHLEIGEQFDKATGFVKSVRNLTWSYSSFLSAVRARAAVPGGAP